MSPGLFADLVLIKGKVVTVDRKGTVAEAVAVRDNKIVKVGTTKQIKNLAGKGTKIIDLRGRTVLPGMMDPHVHMIADAAKALDTDTLDCRDFYHPEIRSLEDILEIIRRHAEKVPKDQWVKAEGSPMQPFRLKERRFPNRWDLDKVTGEHPAYITFGAHVTVVNTNALKLANVTRDTPNPIGGWIEKEDTGEPTGILREKARPLVMNLMYPNGREVNEEHIKRNEPIPEIREYSYELMKKGAEYAIKKCLERGCTTVHDIVTSAQQVRAYQELLAEGRLKMRIVMQPRVYESHIRADSILNLGLLTGFGNDWLKIGAMKMSIDGGITGCNAAFYEPYVHEPDNRGVIRIPQETLDELVGQLHRAGLQCMVHAIGDRAADMVLDTYEKTLAAFPRKNHRHRIEHQPSLGEKEATVKRIDRMKKLGVIPVPNVGLDTYYMGDTLIEVLGAKRMQMTCAFKTLIKRGFKPTNGTDAPGYVPVDPLREIWACATRTRMAGGQLTPEECTSVIDAIRIHTIYAAYAEFAEDRKGSIEPGKLADLVVLAEDPLTVQPRRIKDIKVDYTIVDGKVMYMRRR